MFGKREAGFRAITLLVYGGEKGCFKFPCALCVEPPSAASERRQGRLKLRFWFGFLVSFARNARLASEQKLDDTYTSSCLNCFSLHWGRLRRLSRSLLVGSSEGHSFRDASLWLLSHRSPCHPSALSCMSLDGTSASMEPFHFSLSLAPVLPYSTSYNV